MVEDIELKDVILAAAIFVCVALGTSVVALGLRVSLLTSIVIGAVLGGAAAGFGIRYLHLLQPAQPEGGVATAAVDIERH